MPTISQLVIYPIKSCAGLSVDKATLTTAGLVHSGVGDREWMVVDPSGRFLTQREFSRMARIVPQVRDGLVSVTFPDMAALPLERRHLPEDESRMVAVWDDHVIATDCGEVAAAWFTQVIGTPCRLVRFRENVVRNTSTKWTAGVAAEARFADGYPLLAIGEASLDDLNARLVAAGRDAVPMNRFRGNLIIEGLDAFEEDYMAGFTIGDAVVTPVKPCSRCPIPSIDQATGIPGPDLLDILQQYRANVRLDGAVCFGMNCIVTAGVGAELHVGQTIDAELNF
jgi:uncharacterized protein YcbX